METALLIFMCIIMGLTTVAIGLITLYIKGVNYKLSFIAKTLDHMNRSYDQKPMSKQI